MAKITKKALSPPPRNLDKEIREYLTRMQMSTPDVYIYVEDLNPSSVSATSYSTQTFTVEGLETSNAIIVTPPNLTSGLYLVSSWVSATDILSLVFYNSTGSSINEGSGEYKIVAIDT